MDAWYEDECNEIHGTDGTIFPPFHEKEEGFKIFVPQMCKTLHAEYQHPSKYAGIKTNRFTVDFDVNRFGPANCFCRDHEVCPPAGMLDLFPCIGTPIAISKPHFYQGNCKCTSFNGKINRNEYSIGVNTLCKIHIYIRLQSFIRIMFCSYS